VCVCTEVCADKKRCFRFESVVFVSWELHALLLGHSTGWLRDHPAQSRKQDHLRERGMSLCHTLTLITVQNHRLFLIFPAVSDHFSQLKNSSPLFIPPPPSLLQLIFTFHYFYNLQDAFTLPLPLPSRFIRHILLIIRGICFCAPHALPAHDTWMGGAVLMLPS